MQGSFSTGYWSIFSSFKDLNLQHLLSQDQASCDAIRQECATVQPAQVCSSKAAHPTIKLPAKTNWIKLRSDYMTVGLQGLFTLSFLQ